MEADPEGGGHLQVGQKLAGRFAVVNDATGEAALDRSRGRAGGVRNSGGRGGFHLKIVVSPVMRRFVLFRLVLALLLAVFAAFSQEPSAGAGPVSETVRRLFSQAFFRSGFHNLVSLPAVYEVRRYGSLGLIQEFNDTARTPGVRYALVKPNTSDQVSEAVDGVYQVYPDMFSYYNSIGPNTAGYPTQDTSNCPVVDNNPCRFQLFDKNYALFVYQFATSTISGTNFAVKDPFFSRWRLLGALGGLGPAIGPEETATSGAGTGATGTLQRFRTGAMFTYTAGTLAGRLVAVQFPVWDLYQSQGGHTGFLGFPVSDPLVVSGDQRRQNFEGGAIDYRTGGGGATLRLPVATVSVNVSRPVQRLDLGETVKLTATTFASNGALLEGRAVTWLSSNTRILVVGSSGTEVDLRAVGGGSATITAVSEGKSSRVMTFFVNAPCCQVGEGAPTAVLQQSFTDAVTRNRLNLRLPSQSPVRRVAAGYVQELVSADGNTRYLLAKPDSSSNAFLVTGVILERYDDLGGPGGLLGYPTQDPSAGGRQLFTGGALAGNPAIVVTAPILTRWAAQGYENSPARLPSAPAESALSFTATQGQIQLFAGGAFVAHTTGNLANRTYFIANIPLGKYNAEGGAAGQLGLPVAEEFSVSGRRRQEYEGGFLTYTPGESVVDLEAKARRPQISASPPTVAAGSRVRIAASGFPQGATIRITVGAQPDFLVETPSGAYAYETVIPANTQSQLVNLRAADANGTALAVGSFVVQASAQTLARITKLRGDLQAGYPGSRLPIPLRIAVRDEGGSPLAGIAVRYNASPGAGIESAVQRTDARGEAQAFLRLPEAEVPALATAEAAGQVVTFTARTVAGSLANFPKFTQTAELGPRGALLAASAAIVRHLQNEGKAASANGPADPASLNAYLRELCLFNARGERFCDGFIAPPGAAEPNVNLWRLDTYTGSNLDAEPLAPNADSIRDLLADGRPALVALAIQSANGAVLGSHFVAGIGVGPGGAILIHDPSPALNRTNLDEYLAGFTAGGRQIKGAISAVVSIGEPEQQSGGFLIASTQAPEVRSRMGACGMTAVWPGAAYTGAAPQTTPPPHYFRFCPGTLSEYQLDFGAATRMTFADLTNQGGTGEFSPADAASFRASRQGANWTVAPLEVAFTAANVVNAASFAPGLSPGVLAALFGTGLSRSGDDVTIEAGGLPAQVLGATPFQVNFRISPDVGTGPQVLRVQGPYGSAERTVNLAAVSPGLFSAVVNQNNSLNSTANPASRGQVVIVYATGLGPTRAQGNLQVVQQPVTAAIGGRAVPVAFAGAAPGLPGVYQVNLQLSVNSPPGVEQVLRLEQAGVVSNAIAVSIQ